MDLVKEKEIVNLYEDFRKPLWRFISYKVSDTHAAEEILNDVFLKAYNSIETLREDTKIKSWLYKIASNQIVDYYRKRKDTYVEVDENIPSIQEEENIFHQLDCCLEELLEKLPNQYSKPLKAVYLNEFTQKEYSEQNNIKLSTVKSQIKRGKESMKQFFEQCCDFEKDRLDNTVEFIPKSNICKKC